MNDKTTQPNKNQQATQADKAQLGTQATPPKSNVQTGTSAPIQEKGGTTTVIGGELSKEGTQGTNPESKPDEPVDIAELFQAAFKAVEDDATATLHLNNIVTLTKEILEVKRFGATQSTYEMLAHKLVSLTNSLGVIPDVAFVTAYPAFLDAFQAAKETGALLTDTVQPYKVFTINNPKIGLTKGHAYFLTGTAELADKATRKHLGSQMDLTGVFQVLPDSKRTCIAEILRA